jgi:quinol-cytochrome oxidoreductase complex cytochrome b subunit
VVLHPVLRDVARGALVPDKLWGVLVMFGAIAVILFLVPWLDKSPVKSIRYRVPAELGDAADVRVCFVWLGKIGAGPGTDPTETIIGARADLPLLRLLHHHAGVDEARMGPSRCRNG